MAVDPGRVPRAVTLFELDELARLAETRDKYVLLMVRPCVKCGNSRAHALLPLLANKGPKVFTELVIHERTASEVLALT